MFHACIMLRTMWSYTVICICHTLTALRDCVASGDGFSTNSRILPESSTSIIPSFLVSRNKRCNKIKQVLFYVRQLQRTLFIQGVVTYVFPVEAFATRIKTWRDRELIRKSSTSPANCKHFNSYSLSFQPILVGKVVIVHSILASCVCSQCHLHLCSCRRPRGHHQ